MVEPLQEFNQFMSWMQNGAKRPLTQDQARRLRLWVRLYRVYTLHGHLLLLLSPKADTHFIVPRTVEGWVDMSGWYGIVVFNIPLNTL